MINNLSKKWKVNNITGEVGGISILYNLGKFGWVS